MKRRLIYALTLFFVLFILAAAAPAAEEPAAAPRVVAPERTYKFNPVVDGTKVEHDFVIQNYGDAPLHIRRVKTG